MNVALTGHRGFIGRHVLRLLGEPHYALPIDRADPTSPIDLCDMADDALDGTDAVIHCAAHADVRNNWEPGQLDAIVRDNGVALRSLLDAASRVRGLKRFVFVSTGAVYADQLSPYAASKLSGEAWCKAYAARLGWKLTIVRPAAVFGSGYHHGHVADFVRMARENGEIRALTIGASRDALHVDDLAELLVDKATGGAPFDGYMRGREPWGCRDTARLMKVPAHWTDSPTGWLGDTATSPPNALIGQRSIRSGVEDSLRSLGWEI